MSKKEEHAWGVPWFHSGCVHHKGFRSGQCNKACTASSWCILHLLQVPVVMILRQTRFALVGRVFASSPDQMFHFVWNIETPNLLSQWLQSFILRWTRLPTDMLFRQKLVPRFNSVDAIPVEGPNQHILLNRPTKGDIFYDTHFKRIEAFF